MRVRGLKRRHALSSARRSCVAPHAGAWIETGHPAKIQGSIKVAPHAGAWIETKSQAKKYELQQKEIARQEAIIKRYRQYNREKSIRAAESRQKALDKMTLIEKPSYSQDIRLSFKCKSQSGIDVLKVKGLSMGFD